MFQVKLMKNQMPVLIGQIHGDFKVTAYNFGQVYLANLNCSSTTLTALITKFKKMRCDVVNTL